MELHTPLGRLDAKPLVTSILLGVFGGFYTFLADVSSLLPFNQSLSPRAVIGARIAVSAVVAILAFLLTYVISQYRRRIAAVFGFYAIFPRWFPGSTEKRIELSRKLLSEMFSEGGWPITLASVSGEWDICRPFPEKELREVFDSRKCEMRVLLAHPESENLRRRCAAEKTQDLGIMKRKIIHNTEYLTAIGRGKCTVRWYLTSPTFHLLADSRRMHFSPFIDGVPGHDTRRYVVLSENPLYGSFMKWFDEAWGTALDPSREMAWVTRQARFDQAVFLDRDDTLIKDVCYFGNHKNVRIEILPHVIDGLRLLQDAGFRLIVVSNQQSVGLKVNDERELALLTKKINRVFQARGIAFDAFYFCPHPASFGCNCRKPRPQLFERAATDFGLDLARCDFIGNSDADEGVSSYLPQLRIHIVSEAVGFLAVAKAIVEAHGRRQQRV